MNQLLISIMIKANIAYVSIILYIIWSPQNALKLSSPWPPPYSLVISLSNLALLDTKMKKITNIALRLLFDIPLFYFKYLVENIKKNIPNTNERENWLLFTDEPVGNEKQPAGVQDFLITWLLCLTIDTWSKKFELTLTKKYSQLAINLNCLYAMLYIYVSCRIQRYVVFHKINRVIHNSKCITTGPKHCHAVLKVMLFSIKKNTISFTTQSVLL